MLLDMQLTRKLYELFFVVVVVVFVVVVRGGGGGGGGREGQSHELSS